MEVIVGRQHTRGAMRRPGNKENIGLRQDSLHSGPAEKLGNDPARGQAHSNRKTFSPVAGGDDDEPAIELQLIYDARDRVPQAISRRLGGDIAQTRAEFLRKSLDVGGAIVAPWKCRDSHCTSPPTK